MDRRKNKSINNKKKLVNEEESQIFKKYFESYLEYAGMLFLVLDKELCVSHINKKGVELLGYPKKDIIGKDWFMKFLPEDKRIETKEYFMKALRGEVPVDSYYENHVITKSGVKTLQWQNTLLKDASGKIFGILASAEDITERKKAEAEILREKAFLDQLLETDPESIVITDNIGTVLRVNSEFVHMFGYEVDEAIGQNIDDLVAPPGHQEEARTITESILQGERVSLESVRRKKDNTLLNVSLIGSPVQIAGKQEAVYAIYRDITERKSMEEEMKRFATVDSLTQIFNKKAGIETLNRDIEASLSTKTPTTLVFIDANGLKLINDKYGHIEGDEYLKLIARNMSDRVGEAGTVFRFGGDELIILLPKSDKKKAVKLLNEIEKTIENLSSELQKPYKMSISYGFAVFDPEHPVSSDTLLATADKEMYKMKNSFYEHKRIRAEETLRRNEEKFKTLIETTDTGFHILDAQGRVIDANKEFIRITGYDTLEEILGRNVSEWTAPHDRERSATEVKKCIEQGYVKNLEIDYVNRIGQITPIEINASVIGSGDSAKIFSLCRDITKRKQDEKVLCESEERYRMLIQNLGEGIGFVNPEEQFTFANASAEDIFGVPPSGLMGHSLREFTRPEQFGMIREQTNRHQDGEKIIYEIEISRPNGEKRNLLITAVPRFESQGKFVGTLGVFRDITERKKAEENLKNSNEQLKKMYNFQNIIRRLNQFLLKCDNEGEIYQKVCDIFIESDLIKFVWIGLAEEGTFDVKPAAYAGIEKGYINSIKAKWDNSKYGRGPTGTAIKTQKPVLIGDIRTDPTYMPWIKEALKRGFLSIISLPLIHEGKALGVLDIYSDKKDAFIEEDIELFKEVAGNIAIGIKSIRLEKNLQERSKQLEKSVENIIFTMAKMSESKDPYTAGHQQRVSQLATAIARKMGLSEDRIEAIKFASLIHDIGKFSIPGEILSKPSKLSETEFALIKEHPKTGYDIIKDVEFPWEITSIILQHHERLDGSGYPMGLKDKEILLEAKILAVADVVEAMSSFRPYRPAFGIDKALEEIFMNKGKLYDSDAVDACIKLFKEDGFKFE